MNIKNVMREIGDDVTKSVSVEACLLSTSHGKVYDTKTPGDNLPSGSQNGEDDKSKNPYPNKAHSSVETTTSHKVDKLRCRKIGGSQTTAVDGARLSLHQSGRESLTKASCMPEWSSRCDDVEPKIKGSATTTTTSNSGTAMSDTAKHEKRDSPATRERPDSFSTFRSNSSKASSSSNPERKNGGTGYLGYSVRNKHKQNDTCPALLRKAASPNGVKKETYPSVRGTGSSGNYAAKPAKSSRSRHSSEERTRQNEKRSKHGRRAFTEKCMDSSQSSSAVKSRLENVMVRSRKNTKYYQRSSESESSSSSTSAERREQFRLKKKKLRSNKRMKKRDTRSPEHLDPKTYVGGSLVRSSSADSCSSSPNSSARVPRVRKKRSKTDKPGRRLRQCSSLSSDTGSEADYGSFDSGRAIRKLRSSNSPHAHNSRKKLFSKQQSDCGRDDDDAKDPRGARNVPETKHLCRVTSSKNGKRSDKKSKKNRSAVAQKKGLTGNVKTSSVEGLVSTAESSRVSLDISDNRRSSSRETNSLQNDISTSKSNGRSAGIASQEVKFVAKQIETPDSVVFHEQVPPAFASAVAPVQNPAAFLAPPANFCGYPWLLAPWPALQYDNAISQQADMSLSGQKAITSQSVDDIVHMMRSHTSVPDDCFSTTARQQTTEAFAADACVSGSLPCTGNFHSQSPWGETSRWNYSPAVLCAAPGPMSYINDAESETIERWSQSNTNEHTHELRSDQTSRSSFAPTLNHTSHLAKNRSEVVIYNGGNRDLLSDRFETSPVSSPVDYGQASYTLPGSMSGGVLKRLPEDEFLAKSLFAPFNQANAVKSMTQARREDTEPIPSERLYASKLFPTDSALVSEEWTKHCRNNHQHLHACSNDFVGGLQDKLEKTHATWFARNLYRETSTDVQVALKEKLENVVNNIVLESGNATENQRCLTFPLVEDQITNESHCASHPESVAAIPRNVQLCKVRPEVGGLLTHQHATKTVSGEGGRHSPEFLTLDEDWCSDLENISDGSLQSSMDDREETSVKKWNESTKNSWPFKSLAWDTVVFEDFDTCFSQRCSEMSEISASKLGTKKLTLKTSGAKGGGKNSNVPKLYVKITTDPEASDSCDSGTTRSVGKEPWLDRVVSLGEKPDSSCSKPDLSTVVSTETSIHTTDSVSTVVQCSAISSVDKDKVRELPHSKPLNTSPIAFTSDSGNVKTAAIRDNRQGWKKKLLEKAKVVCELSDGMFTPNDSSSVGLDGKHKTACFLKLDEKLNSSELASCHPTERSRGLTNNNQATTGNGKRNVQVNSQDKSPTDEIYTDSSVAGDGEQYLRTDSMEQHNQVSLADSKEQGDHNSFFDWSQLFLPDGIEQSSCHEQHAEKLPKPSLINENNVKNVNSDRGFPSFSSSKKGLHSNAYPHEKTRVPRKPLPSISSDESDGSCSGESDDVLDKSQERKGNSCDQLKEMYPDENNVLQPCGSEENGILSVEDSSARSEVVLHHPGEVSSCKTNVKLVESHEKILSTSVSGFGADRSINPLWAYGEQERSAGNGENSEAGILTAGVSDEPGEVNVLKHTDDVSVYASVPGSSKLDTAAEPYARDGNLPTGSLDERCKSPPGMSSSDEAEYELICSSGRKRAKPLKTYAAKQNAFHSKRTKHNDVRTCAKNTEVVNCKKKERCVPSPAESLPPLEIEVTVDGDSVCRKVLCVKLHVFSD